MIDSHSHLYCDAFDDDRIQVIARARDAGVRHIVLPGENLASVQRQVAMRNAFPGYISLALGLHPEEVRDNYLTELEQIKPLLTAHHAVAVGEIGMDLYWDKTYRDEQAHALHLQLQWCKELGLPFIIHCRDAFDEIMWVFDNFGEALPPGVFHSFTGTPAQVEQARSHGDFYFGVNGIVTFKKSDVKEILPAVGLNRLLLETDAPYLAPVPHRGKRNESAFLPAVAQFVANYLQLPLEQIVTATTANATTLFKLN